MPHLSLAHRGIRPDEYPCDIIGPFYYEADILQEPLNLGRGRAAPNGRPGLGVELNEDLLQNYRSDGQRMS
jgi:muconate cycloisomerase